MLQNATITFLETILVNNNKTWFDKYNEEYLQAKEDFEIFITGILEGLATNEPLFKEQKAKDCIYRIYRDVRFSKDKTPYKHHFGAFFSKGGRKFPGAGYYLHIEPGGKSFAGGGLWAPEAALLKKVRQEIDYNFEEFTKITKDKKFRKLFKDINGERLKKIPQGYEENNPAIEYLKMKSYTVGNNLQDTDLTDKNFTKKVLDSFTTLRPFIDFLNKGLD